MADDESSSTSDESLDVKSVKFDPMKALYSRKIDLSSTRAPIYDNVSKFEAVMSGLSGQMKVRIALARADSTHTQTHHQLTHFPFHLLWLFQKNVQTTAAKQGECSRQRFLPHQGKISSLHSKREYTQTQSVYCHSRRVRLCRVARPNLWTSDERWRPCEMVASPGGRLCFIHDNSHVVSNFNMLTVSSTRNGVRTRKWNVEVA